MRKLLAIVLLLTVVSCSKFDDSDIWNKLNEHESRIEKLETFCNQINTNISSLQALVTALQNNDYISNIAPIMEGDKEIGYTITFAKSGSITIYHGKDGKNGTDGKDGIDGANGTNGMTPIIGVKQYEGVYYWTINGTWLKDDDGNKIKAEGADGKDGVNGDNGINGADGKNGITPKLRIEAGYWQVSYDNGSSWTTLGVAAGESVQDSGVVITKDDINVYCKFPDGYIITIPFGELPVPYNQIWYTTTDGKEIAYKDHWFGEKVKSNVYENGKGIITLDKEIKWVNESAFYKCSTLTSVTIPNSIEGISEGAFTECVNLQEFKGRFAEDGGRCLIYKGNLIAVACSTMTFIYTIPNGVESIGYAAFKGCGLYKVNLPVGLYRIGDFAFAECPGLFGVIYQEHDVITQSGNTNHITNQSFTVERGAFQNCTNLLHFPFKNTSKIGAFAFENCTNLRAADCCEWGLSIERKAFSGCINLAEVHIYFNDSIGDNAFDGCTSLSKVYCHQNTPAKIGTNVFNSNAYNRKIYVPMSAVDAYKTANNWSEYADAISGTYSWN